MLLTRCPECDTTFRVTDETLKKASGQVRCGRCASVFNAYAELHDPAAKSRETEQQPTALPNAPSPPRAPDPAAAAAALGAPIRMETKRVAQESAAGSNGAPSVTAVIGEARAAEAAAAAEVEAAGPANPRAISATEVDRVLATDQPVPYLAYAWTRGGEPEQRRAHSGWWTFA